jgi:hypothetical protein
LIEQLNRRIADEKVLQLIWRFLKAGYLENWRYYKTYSGVPQGNILGPLLANAFLNQLDEFMIDELAANRTQPRAESDARRNPEYRRLNDRIRRCRKKLSGLDTQERRQAIKEIRELERRQRKMPCYAKDRKHPCKVKYACPSRKPHPTLKYLKLERSLAILLDRPTHPYSDGLLHLYGPHLCSLLAHPEPDRLPNNARGREFRPASATGRPQPENSPAATASAGSILLL